MTVNAQIEANILRYYHAEQWKVGTIAAQLGVHHTVVSRVLFQKGLVPHGKVRDSMVTRYLPFIHETLAQYPTLNSARLYEMVKQRGYEGGPDHFRHVISRHRPRRVVEAYLRLKTLPGEQAQVDWGHFGHIAIGRAKRPLMAFAMVLSYSRQPFVRFCLNAQMENFLRGHVAAFEAFGGVPRVLLYDNLKSAVLERQGDAIRFNPALLEFAGHYRYEPRPVAVARGNEKGRVERTIRYVRENFFAAREFADVDDLNRQVIAWCNGPAAQRLCPEDRTETVQQAFESEQDKLLALPDNPYVTEEQVEVRIGKTPYARFDLNDYSIPYTHVQRTLTVRATPDTVRILEGSNELARHHRSYDKGQQIENPQHIAELVERKAAAHQQRGMSRLVQMVPAAQELLTLAAQRGEHMGGITIALLNLTSRYSAEEVQTAVQSALARGVPHPHAVRLALEQQRHAKDQPPPVDIQLPEHLSQKDHVIQQHALNEYDQLGANS